MIFVFPGFRAAATLVAASFAIACPALAASQDADAAAGHAPSRGRADAYVQHVLPGSSSQSVGRWRDPLCPLVSGLARDQAEALLERLSVIAREAGAPLGAADCHPNLYIIAAADPKTTLKAWVKRQPLLFGPGHEAEVQRVIETARPVRVWLKVASTGVNGHYATDHSQALFAMSGQSSVPVLNWTDPTHLSASTARYIAGAAVVLGPQVGKVSLGQLAAYIALSTFAEVNPDADLGSEPSILTLFRPGGAAPEGLSAADEAYLKALYRVQPNSLGQKAAIADHMAGG